MNTPEHLPVMTENRKQLNIMLLKLLHLALTTVIFYVCWLLFRYGRLTGMSKYAFRYNYYVAAGFVACVVFFNRTYNAYLLGYMRIRTLAVSQFMSQFFSTGLMWLVVCVAWKHWDDPLDKTGKMICIFMCRSSSSFSWCKNFKMDRRDFRLTCPFMIVKYHALCEWYKKLKAIHI